MEPPENHNYDHDPHIDPSESHGATSTFLPNVPPEVLVNGEHEDTVVGFSLSDPSSTKPSRPEDEPAGEPILLPDFSIQPSQDHLQQLHDQASEFVRLLMRHRRSRQEALHLRDNTNYLQQASTDKARHLLESKEALIGFASNLAEQSAQTPNPLQVEALRSQLIDDHAGFENAIENTRAHEEELSNTEFYMQGKEEGLVGAAERLVGLLEDMGFVDYHDLEAAARSRTATQPASSRSPSPAVPPTLADYYDKAGDANIMRERLVELDAEHSEERVLRIFKEDQDISLEVSEEDFEQQHQTERKAAILAIEIAEASAKEALQLCLLEGLNPHSQKVSPQRSPHFSEDYLDPSEITGSAGHMLVDQRDSMTPSLLSLPTRTSGYFDGTTLIFEDQTSKASIKPRRRKKQEQIRRWIEASHGDQRSSELDGLQELEVPTYPRRLNKTWRSLPELGQTLLQQIPTTGSRNSSAQPQVSNNGQELRVPHNFDWSISQREPAGRLRQRSISTLP